MADGGKLIIYAPHIREISAVHGTLIRRTGYHTRDYVLKQWEKFQKRTLGRPGPFAPCTEEGILDVSEAGEMLYRLTDPPDWARASELPSV